MKPLNLTAETVAHRMSRLLNNEDFKVFLSLGVNERIDAVEVGKKTRDGVQFAVVEGMDKILTIPDKWISKFKRAKEKEKQTGEDE